MLQDTTDGGKWMTVRELGDALNTITANGTNKLDVLFADACLMQMVETAYQVRNTAQYYVASENTIWIPGSSEQAPYRTYISGITDLTTPLEISRKIVSAHASWLNAPSAYRLGYTISAVDLTKLPDLVTAISNLATTLRQDVGAHAPTIAEARTATQKFDSYDEDSNPNTYQLTEQDEYIDLWDFADELRSRSSDVTVRDLAQKVKDAVDTYVVRDAEAHRGGQPEYFPNLAGSHGVAIYLPPGDFKRSFYNAANLDFAADAVWGPSGSAAASTTGPGWGSLVVSYVEARTPNAPDNPNPPALVAPGATSRKTYIFLPLVLRR